MPGSSKKLLEIPGSAFGFYVMYAAFAFWKPLQRERERIWRIQIVKYKQKQRREKKLVQPCESYDRSDGVLARVYRI